MAGNANSGRRKQLSSLKRLKGNPSRKRIVDDVEVPVAAPPLITEMPEFLTQPREKILFNRIIGDYQHRRIARPADIHAYARWACYMHKWMVAKAESDKIKTFYEFTQGGATRYIATPHFADMLKLESAISHLEDKLGLTPIARQHIIRGLASMPADFGGAAPHERKGEIKEADTPAESPIGFGRIN
jgi:hypothetical protein